MTLIPEICKKCSGRKITNEPCVCCNGTGKSMMGMALTVCAMCHGDGKDRCARCSGTGKIYRCTVCGQVDRDYYSHPYSHACPHCGHLHHQQAFQIR